MSCSTKQNEIKNLETCRGEKKIIKRGVCKVLRGNKKVLKHYLIPKFFMELQLVLYPKKKKKIPTCISIILFYFLICPIIFNPLNFILSS